MKNILLPLLILFINNSTFSQSNTSDVGKCMEGTYTFTNRHGDVNEITLSTSMTFEYQGNCYKSKATEETRKLGKLVLIGKWGVIDNNTINIISGKADKNRSDKDAIYYCYHSQNSGYKTFIDISKGELKYNGDTYKRQGGPCSLNNHKTESDGLFNNKYVDPNAQIKSITADLINQLATNSNNETINQVAQNLNNTREWIDVFRRADPDNTEGFDKVEDVTMIISGIAGLFKNSQKNEPTEEKRWYIHNGKQVQLTPSEAKAKFNLIQTPFSPETVIEIRNNIRTRIGLNQKMIERDLLIKELLLFSEQIDTSKYNNLRKKLHIEFVKQNSTGVHSSFMGLLRLFEYEGIENHLVTIDSLNKGIKKLLLQEQMILKEVILEPTIELNTPNSTRESLISFYEKNFKAGDSYEFLTIGASEEEYVNLNNTIKHKNIQYFFPQNINEITPIYLFYSNLKFFYSKYELVGIPYEEQLKSSLSSFFQLNIPLFENDFLLITDKHFPELGLIKNSKRYYINSYYRDIVCISGNHSKLESYYNDSYNPKFMHLDFLEKVRNNVNLTPEELELYLNANRSSYNNISLETMRKYASKAKSVSYTDWKTLRKLNEKILENKNIDYRYLQQLFLELNLFHPNFSNDDLSSLNEFITFIELPYVYAEEGDNSILSYIRVFDRPDHVKSDTYFIHQYNKPFMRLYLERYYLEKSMGHTEHLTHDAEIIKSHLNQVLIDYIRHHSDMSAAQFVLKDLGIIE